MHVCEQLAQGRYIKVKRPGVEPATSWSDVLNITSARHTKVYQFQRSDNYNWSK